MQTIAAIDVGSNAIRLIIGRLNYGGQVEVIDNLRLPVRLGRDVFGQGQIGEQTAQQALDAFKRFSKVIEDHRVSELRAVATSAMREAANSDLLRDRIARSTGIEIEVISGEEEARLIHLAVLNAIEVGDGYVMLVDIGGGSVEVTLSQGRSILSTESYNMGTVRLLQKLEERTAHESFARLIRDYAEAAKRRIDREIGGRKVELCIGTGGNIEEMGKLREKIFKRDSDKRITLEELDALVETLGRLNVKERERKFKLKPDRADVILPASIVLQIIAHKAGAKEILIPHVGLKDGVLWDMAQGLVRGLESPSREQAWVSAMQLGEKYQFDSDHGRQVSRFAGILFDQTRELHNLDDENKLLLEIAALLHDIGHFISTLDHHKHGWYILTANPLIGLSENMHAIVANIVRYHRKSTPATQDENFRALPPKDRLIVSKLSALLRLADGLDVSHTKRVREVSMERSKKNWRLSIKGDGNLMLETWALQKRRALFQDVFGIALEIGVR